MSKQRSRAQAKQHHRRAPILTPEERLTLELKRMADADRRIARADRRLAVTMRDMLGDHQDYRKPKKNEFDRWELCELMRKNVGKHGDDLVLRLSNDAYIAKRLGCYC